MVVVAGAGVWGSKAGEVVVVAGTGVCANKARGVVAAAGLAVLVRHVGCSSSFSFCFSRSFSRRNL